MSQAESFDVIVIGAGPAGEVAAGRIAERSKLSVVLVERHLVGGECSFYACMPSKALLRPKELLDEVARVPGASGGRESVDVQATLERRDEVIAQLDDSGHLPWLTERGIELVRGDAQLDGERRVRVGERVLEAREAVIVATGSTASLPPIPGLAEAAAWTSHEITVSSVVPERLVILGGGVVAVEMAQAWRSLGSQVTIVEAADRLLPREEPFAGEELAQALGDEGVKVRVGAKVTGVEGGSGSQVTLLLDGGESVSGSHLLVAVGRKAITEGLGLETLGLDPGKPIEVDDTMRVPGHGWLYAIGDVNGVAQLTHMGKYQARIAADRILGDESARTQVPGPLSPRVVFTDPQIAAAGHTLESALAAGITAKAIDLTTSGTAGSSFHGRNTPGTTRFVVDTTRDVLVGATFVGPEVGEFIQAATIAIVAEVPIATLAQAIPPFPTRSELWLKFVEAYGL